MLEQQGLCGDGTYATWAEQLREGDQQVDGEDEQFAHGANGTMTASARKTARRQADCVILRIRHPHHRLFQFELSQRPYSAPS